MTTSSYSVEGDYLRQPVWIEIRAVPMNHWDPIGISKMPEAADEYDAYIPKIKALLRAGAPVETFVDYLDRITSERMGDIGQKEPSHAVASRLMLLTDLLEPLG